MTKLLTHYDENAIIDIVKSENDVSKATEQLKENSVPGPGNFSHLPKNKDDNSKIDDTGIIGEAKLKLKQNRR